MVLSRSFVGDFYFETVKLTSGIGFETFWMGITVASLASKNRPVLNEFEYFNGYRDNIGKTINWMRVLQNIRFCWKTALKSGKIVNRKTQLYTEPNTRSTTTIAE